MKKKIIIIVICMVIFASLAGATPHANTLKKLKVEEPIDRGYSHTILGEYGTQAFLKNIFKNGWHPFYYIALICSKNTHAYKRAINELGLLGYPTVFWDGGYRKNVGAPSIQTAMERYNYSIIKCGERTVADIDLSLDVTWLGAVNNDPEDGATNVPIEQIMNWTNTEMIVNVTIDNNEESQYNGHLHVYVAENESSMGWEDNEGNLYTFAFLDYAFNEDISISAGGTWEDSANWDGMEHTNGTHFYERVTQHNTWTIASVFDEDTDYTDETAGLRAGFGTDPKTFNVYFGNTTPPPLIYSNTSMKSYYHGILDWNTTYYWKVDTWDARGNATYGKIWSFTTRDNYAPYSPNNPNPWNNSLNIPINTNLSWIGGDPNGDKIEYDVYFGLTSPPPLVASNINDPKYDPPGNLEFEKKYYWKIIAKEVKYNLTASGPIWNFHTQKNLPPNKAKDPIPPNGANNVPVDAVLNWTGDDPNPGDKLKYDVYFGVTNPPTKKASNISNNFYDPPGDMELYQEYYWYITTWDSEGLKAKGDIWSFSTGINLPPDKPTITGSKKGKVGEEYEYNFSTTDPENQSIFYEIHWGDGNETGWLGPHNSGTKIILNHTWIERGNYKIRCRARDIYNEFSEWAILEISMPKNKPFDFNFNILSWFFERFPKAFPILRQLLELT